MARRSIVNKMESLMKDQEGLMKEDGKAISSSLQPRTLCIVFGVTSQGYNAPLVLAKGWSFLTPVIGFYCQRCEEFIGDLMNAESHAATHVGNHRLVSCILHQLFLSIFSAITVLCYGLLC